MTVCQYRENNGFVLAFGVQAVGAGQVDNFGGAAIRQFAVANLLINRNPRKVSNFLI